MATASEDKNRLLLILMAKEKNTIRDACKVLGLEKSAVHARVMWLIKEGYMTGRKSETGRYLAHSFEMTEHGKTFASQ